MYQLNVSKCVKSQKSKEVIFTMEDEYVHKLVAMKFYIKVVSGYRIVAKTPSSF